MTGTQSDSTSLITTLCLRILRKESIHLIIKFGQPNASSLMRRSSFDTLSNVFSKSKYMTSAS